MKYTTIGALALVAFLVACTSPATRDSWEQLEALRSQIEADGIITPEEAAQYVDAAAAHLRLERQDLTERNWGDLLATAGGTLLASFLGVNAYRNRSLPGTKRKA